MGRESVRGSKRLTVFHAPAHSRVYGEHTSVRLVFTLNMSYEEQKMDVRSGSSSFNKAQGDL